MKLNYKEIRKRVSGVLDIKAKRVVLGLLTSVFIALLSALLYVLLPRNSIVVKNQPIGHDNIFVGELFLLEPGYLVVQFEGELYRHTDYIPAGVYSGTYFDLFGEKPLPEKEPAQGDEVVVVLYKDNGDTLFNSGIDVPAKNYFGRVVKRKIILK